MFNRVMQEAERVIERTKILQSILGGDEMCDSFDEIMTEHKKTLGEGKKMILDTLVQEIKDCNYTTFSQLNGAINKHLDRLKEKGVE